MNVKAISLNVGKALLVSSLFMLLSLGVFPLIFVRNSPALSMHEGLVTIVISWLLSFVMGMLPYILWGGPFTVINALFESVSGYTTTGATILTDIEALPHSLLFWRSSTQYIGGLGVVVFLLYILPDNSPLRLKRTNLEMSSIAREGYQYRSSQAIRVIIRVYIALLVLSFGSLVLAGMPVFDAINHALTISATGGFSVKNASIGFYDSHVINIIVMFFTIVSSIHFGLIYMAVAMQTLKPLRTPVVRYFLSVIVVASIVTCLTLTLSGTYDNWGKAAMDASFAVVNYITTAGFANADNAGWPLLASVMLMFCAFQCGCSGSTTGGLKADRMLLSFRVIIRQIRHNANPSEVHRITVGGRPVKDEVAIGAVTYLALYCLIVMLSTLLLLSLGVNGQTAFSGTVASVGNVGPALGDIGMAHWVKFIFSVDMLLGRVEIYPVLVVIFLLFKRGR